MRQGRNKSNGRNNNLRSLKMGITIDTPAAKAARIKAAHTKAATTADATKQAEISAVRAERQAEIAAARAARSVGVEDVLQKAGFAGKRDGARLEWKQSGRDSNIKTLGEAWADNLTGASGASGYSLAQHLQVDVDHLPVRAYTPKPPVKPETPPPVEAPENWEHVRQWLTSPLPGRGIPVATIDAAKAAGLIYSDSLKRACFARKGGGAFVRSTKPGDTSKYSKLTFGRGGNPFVSNDDVSNEDRGLFIAESAINALSLLSLNPGYTCIGTGGNFSPEKLHDLIQRAESVYLCFDSDTAGDIMAANLTEAFPQFKSKFVDHKPPADFGDWNDVLTGKRKPAA